MTKTYIQLNLGIKHKQIVHILTVVYLKVLLEGCRKFEFQFYFIDFSQTYLCWLTYIEISGSMKKQKYTQAQKTHIHTYTPTNK